MYAAANPEGNLADSSTHTHTLTHTLLLNMYAAANPEGNLADSSTHTHTHTHSHTHCF